MEYLERSSLNIMNHSRLSGIRHMLMMCAFCSIVTLRFIIYKRLVCLTLDGSV